MLLPHESFPYHCFQLGTFHLVATGAGAERLAAGGYTPVFIRYAFPLYGTHAPLCPVMAADDRGGIYRGLDAYDWIAERGLLFPRSDVVGLLADGKEHQCFLKELDLGVAALAFVAASPGEAGFGQPLAAAVEVVPHSEWAITPGGDFPTRLAAIVPTFQLHRHALSRAGELLADVLGHPRSIPLRA
jgi:hypothetical protein